VAVKLKNKYLKIAGKNLKSRLIVGTGKYKNFSETAKAVKASAAEMVTVAVRRINITDKKKPIFGIVYNPSTNENFYAIKKKGAFCNEKKITVGETNDLERATIAISSSESDKLEKKKLQIKDVEKIGSIAYKIALVAKGKIDATLSFTRKSDWDIAAASLILEEAGGKISLINGDQISYNTKDLKIPSLISANKIIHKKFCDIIRN